MRAVGNAGPAMASRHHDTDAGRGTARPWRAGYLLGLAWAFTVFNTLRLFTYLPTIRAIHASGASNQHSLLTWFFWFGANLTMGLWLYEQADRRLERAALVNVGNAAMCFVTGVVIVIHR